MFFSTDDPVKEMDQEYFKTFDPFAHFIAAELLSSGTVGEFSVQICDGSRNNFQYIDDPDTDELFSALKESRERANDQRQTLTRVLRYFASENMIIMMLASPPHAPFFRMATKLRGERLNKVFFSISSRKIPDKFKISKNDVSVDNFESCLGLKLFRQDSFFKKEDANELMEMIVEEALLLSGRGAINAFKHGRTVKLGQSLAGKILKGADSKKLLAEILPMRGVQWVEWLEMKKGFAVRTETEEFDYEYDKKRIFQVGLLMRAMKSVRIAEMAGQENVTVKLPEIEKLSGRVKRQHYQTRFKEEE